MRDDAYARAIEMVHEVTSENSVVRLTRTEIMAKTKIKETAFRSFMLGKHPNGAPVGAGTLARKADEILSAIRALQMEKRPEALVYGATRSVLETSDAACQRWYDDHRGAYLCYRFASSEDLIQVSAIDILEKEGVLSFRQIMKIRNPKFGEIKERVVEGNIFPVRRCAHFIYSAKDQISHSIFSELEGVSLRYMKGIVAGLSTDGFLPFASRAIAVKFSDNPHAEIPQVADVLGIDFGSEDEAQRALVLDVIPAKLLPTFAKLLSANGKPGIVRAEVPNERNW